MASGDYTELSGELGEEMGREWEEGRWGREREREREISQILPESCAGWQSSVLSLLCPSIASCLKLCSAPF